MHRVAAEVILSYPGLRSSGSVEYVERGGVQKFTKENL